MSALAPFHPIVQAWFTETLGEPSEPQVQGWPVIRKGGDVLDRHSPWANSIL